MPAGPGVRPQREEFFVGRHPFGIRPMPFPSEGWSPTLSPRTAGGVRKCIFFYPRKKKFVMPLDVLGCTRATLKESACVPWPKGPGNSLNLLRARDWDLQLFSMNEEFPVSASHKLALITSLPFVHTARRYYRLNDLVRSSD